MNMTTQCNDHRLNAAPASVAGSLHPRCSFGRDTNRTLATLSSKVPLRRFKLFVGRVRPDFAPGRYGRGQSMNAFASRRHRIAWNPPRRVHHNM